MRAWLGFLMVLAPSVALAATAPPAKPLSIYVIDVEGGNAVLFVSPDGQSMLIDAGNAGDTASKRDADRIMDAVKDAGLIQIDHLIITHWHPDHYGGLPALAPLIPIKDFIDHGAPRQPGADPGEAFFKTVYPQFYANAEHRQAKVGDKISLGPVTFDVVTSEMNTITKARPGAGKANSECADYKPVDPPFPEDPMSVGVFVTYGQFKTAHLGDVTKNIEYKLACPKNLLGTLDVLLSLHHGQNSSNAPFFIHALRPRIAILNTGTQKGAQPDTMMSLHSSPRLEDVWEMHFSMLSGQEYTTPGMFIANDIDQPSGTMPVAPFVPIQGMRSPAPTHNGKAYWVKVEARPDGSFTVINQRNGFTKTYAK